jgi:hypothetical protein
MSGQVGAQWIRVLLRQEADEDGETSPGERTETFRDRYRFRAGIEATISALDRLTGVKHLRVRGMPAVRFAVVLKVLGLNLLRAAAVRMPENGEGSALAPAYPRVLDGIVSVHGKFVLWVRSVINYLGFGLVPALSPVGRAA